MEFTPEQKKFINNFVVEIKNGDAAIFAGAGLSVSVGFVNWKELLKEFADDLRLDIEKEYDLIGLAQYYVNKHRNRESVSNKIINEFTTLNKGNENHKLLSKLGINTFWTTNYDQLIEKTLEADGKTVERKIRNEDFSRNIKKKDAIIYKMHGDKDSPEEAVLIKDDYESYQDKKELFSTALRGDLLSKTFLFIGFSFDDPNLEYILGRIKVLLKDNPPTHYCFFKEVSEEGFSDEKEYLYAKIKQELKIEDLKRYGIRSILIKEYSHITNILKEINNRLMRSNIFISGAAHSYEPFSEDRAKELIHKLSYRLAEKEYKIISGYGLGIGSMVINGALEYKYQSDYRNLDDLLILRPFPQIQSGDKSISERWTDYRNEIISQAGIAIFMFGNKLDKEGKKVLSSGMKEEFDICLQHNVIPIPIGCTGSIAKEFWSEVVTSHRHLYSGDGSLLVELEEIGKDDITNDMIISKVIDIVDKLQNL